MNPMKLILVNLTIKTGQLWLVYDMRHTFENLTSVREQIELIRSRKNLLVWYTADEFVSPLNHLFRNVDKG